MLVVSTALAGGRAGEARTGGGIKVNDANVVFKPAQMSPERLQEGYLYLWKEFYKSRQGLKELGREERTIQF